ncbi:hypothetical protein [Komagataeibacter europaeus]|uniref:hypothetical protein n=1 Tax=Komagataeibacter europaeus TaxID=33995 RepID=UPI000A570DDF|nr:hypothetical protein [Komagataeibacter europaeus]
MVAGFFVPASGKAGLRVGFFHVRGHLKNTASGDRADHEKFLVKPFSGSFKERRRLEKRPPRKPRFLFHH